MLQTVVLNKLKFWIMIMKVKLMLAVVGLSMSLFLGHADAQVAQSIGVTISVQGQVAATNQQKQQRSLQRGGAIYLNDRVITQKDSKVQLRLQDDSIIVVQPLSEFYVSEFSFNKNMPNNNKCVGNIVKGMLIDISGQGDKKNYQLNSPLATISVRGTGFAVKLKTRDNVPLDQSVYVFEGAVRVKNRCESVVGPCESKSIDIGAGQKLNSATINRLGEIIGHKSSGLLEGDLGNKAVTQLGGRVSITCKAR